MKRITTAVLGAALAAAAFPAAGQAAPAPTKTVHYTVKVNQGILTTGTSVKAKAVVSYPQNTVKDWWSRSTINTVVRDGINNGLEEPYRSEGYRCVPSITQTKQATIARFTCKLAGADTDTSVKLTFTASYDPPTGFVA